MGRSIRVIPTVRTAFGNLTHPAVDRSLRASSTKLVGRARPCKAKTVGHNFVPFARDRHMRLRIHRGTKEIGGTCIEVEAKGMRLVLDVGLPLDAPDDVGARARLLPKISGFRE